MSEYGQDIALRNIEALDPYHRAEVRDCINAMRNHIATLEAENAELRRERDTGCCANCATCTPVGFCKHPDALASVKTHYPMQSDFRCRYWTARLAAPSPDAKETTE